jgi:LmbE family N-acetylglucosaminyl deacetylase
MSNPIKFLNKKLLQKKILWIFAAAVVVLAVTLVYAYDNAVPQVLAQTDVSSLPEATMPVQGQKVLVFSPHPDDETIGVGGFIAQSLKNGASVTVVLVTNGNFRHQESLRYAEFKKATSILGIPESDLVFLNFADSKLDKMDQTQLYNALKLQIDTYNPDIVVFPHPRDANPDHAVIGKIMESILKADPHQRSDYEYLVHYEILFPRPRKYDPNLYLLPPKRLINASDRWQRVPLTQDTENLKSAAIFTYQSQLKDPWLKGLLLSSIRKDELLAVPQTLGAR